MFDIALPRLEQVVSSKDTPHFGPVHEILVLITYAQNPPTVLSQGGVGGGGRVKDLNVGLDLYLNPFNVYTYSKCLPTFTARQCDKYQKSYLPVHLQKLNN